PRAKRPVATLFARGGRGHDQPRFLPGGDELLVVRQEPLGDGASVPDLFVWNWRRKSLRRVTRGAALRNPDPAPDGRSAAAVRCRGGVCDLVRVDLASGEVATLLAGTLQTVFYRPRWAPDGRSLVLAIQEEGRWRLGRVDAATGERRWIDPDDEASRYDAAFLPGGRALVAVSELGGVANLERIDLETGAARPLTRLTGAAAAPEPSPATGHVFYLSLHATGFDLNRVHPDSVALARVEALSPVLAPAAPRPRVPADTLARAPLPPVREYGIGPRRQRLLPWGYHGADGGAFGLLLLSTDPVGRLAWTLRGSYGGDAQPRGGAAAAVWRGWRTAVAGEAFWVRHEPSREDGLLDDLALGPLDGDYAGAALMADRGWTTSFLRQRARAGVSLGALELAEGGSGDRRLAFVEYAATASTTVGARSLAAQAGVHGALGSTHGDGWRRGVATGSLAVRLGWLNARGAVTYGRTGAGAPPWERFQVGGSDGGLVDPSVLSQRIEMPAIPFGHLQGTEILALRASTTVRGLVPYFWAARAGEDADWFRVAGVETSVEMGANTLLRLPGVRLRLGAARVLDEPFEDELEVYASVTYRP
ncbi:MAG TPA: hypothetical protein VFX98_02520, partial [Longimicrobiaceae bacterium]|nr:hypothetical protein [Longimicrobiaceae bacterium]